MKKLLLAAALAAVSSAAHAQYFGTGSNSQNHPVGGYTTSEAPTFSRTKRPIQTARNTTTIQRAATSIRTPVRLAPELQGTDGSRLAIRYRHPRVGRGGTASLGVGCVW